MIVANIIVGRKALHFHRTAIESARQHRLLAPGAAEGAAPAIHNPPRNQRGRDRTPST